MRDVDKGVYNCAMEIVTGESTAQNSAANNSFFQPPLGEAKSINQLWLEISQTLRGEIPETTFKAWMVPNELVEIKPIIDSSKDGCVAIITSPSAFHALKFEKTIGGRVQELLEEYCQKPVELSFQIKLKDGGKSTAGEKAILGFNQAREVAVSEQIKQTVPATINNSQETLNQDPLSSSIQTHESLIVNSSPSPTNQTTESNKQTSSVTTGTTVPSPLPFSEPVPASFALPRKDKGITESLFSDHTVRAAVADRAAELARASGLRPDFTFDTFAISSSNEMAHAAATAVSNKPGVSYNPLFLYGGVGVGKTHLMHAIANNILKNSPSHKIVYCTCEEFTNEVIRAIQNKRTQGLRDKYRTPQVLLIDDIQFLSGKEGVQAEFFHTFEAMIKRYCQVVLTSDRPPQELKLLEERIRSRFEAGLVVDIQQPSFELRTAILLIKASTININLPMDLAQMIASQVDSARKIEGVIKRLKSEVELKHQTINHELVSSILSEEIKEYKLNLRLNPNDVVRAVAKFYNLKPTNLTGQKRSKEVVLARHIAMFLFKTELNLSYVEVGKWFGARDHTSAMHGIKKIDALVNKDEDLQRDINEIKVSLVSGRG